MKTLYLALIASFALLFAACGQSGPLYLPGNPSTVQAPPAETAEDDEDDDEDEERRNDNN